MEVELSEISKKRSFKRPKKKAHWILSDSCILLESYYFFLEPKPVDLNLLNVSILPLSPQTRGTCRKKKTWHESPEPFLPPPDQRSEQGNFAALTPGAVGAGGAGSNGVGGGGGGARAEHQAAINSMMTERMSTDIYALKKQYTRIKRRQQQQAMQLYIRTGEGGGESESRQSFINHRLFAYFFLKLQWWRKGSSKISKIYFVLYYVTWNKSSIITLTTFSFFN